MRRVLPALLLPALRSTRALPLVAALFAVCAAPAVAEEGDAVDAVDLAVAVTLDKQAYELTDGVGAAVTVTNNGTAPATAVSVALTSGTPTVWRWTVPPAAELAPGESTTGTAVNDPFEPGRLVTVYAEVTSAEPDRTPEDNHVDVAAPMLNVAGDVDGLLYRDHDEDGVADPGEALTGVRIYLVPRFPRGSDHSVRTGDGGRFAVSDVLMGAYAAEVVLPGGWQLTDKTVEIRPGPNRVELRAVRALSERLTATLRFDRLAYAVGDTAHVAVTLTNTGATDLPGLSMLCLRLPDVVGPMAEETSVLIETTVAVPAGGTRTFEFADVVTREMWRYGRIDIECRLGDRPGGLLVNAGAAVPGGLGVAHGVVLSAEHDEPVPVPHLGLFLVDRGGEVVARGVTDADGRFWLPDLPAGSYELRLRGPWRPAYDAVQLVDAVVGGGEPVDVMVLPGPATAPPPVSVPPMTSVPSPAPVAPGPAARPAPVHLADTGADVVGLTGLGALLVLAGAALLVVRRRNFVS